ncbi:Zinc/iron permease [Piromyces finnis]|uniref:Zinc/iron permease n=1 Tax=Piromyces finnis TaxID=1754191 RepID=A0A1Y1V4R8_9FUNG|nr:Zinc/iron permease [Piromyces finnis]|eukprot:ORX46637.1 Zinc/iron permease [Piromyces finnis]
MSKISSVLLCISLVLINVSTSLAELTQQEHHPENHNSHSHHHHHHQHSHTKNGYDIQKILLKYLPKNPMVAAMSSVIYITMIPLILLKFLPANLPKSMLNTLLAFALGTVLGDVFLHMIPELMSGETHSELESGNFDHDSEHGHHHDEHLINIGLLMLSGILIFYVLEKIVGIFGGDDDHHGHHHDHGHHHAHHHASHIEHKQEYADKVFSSKNDDQYFGEDEMIKKTNNNLKKRKPLKKRTDENNTTSIPNKAIEKEHKAKIDNIDHGVTNSSYVKAIMQVMASMTHGFTDGLSVTFAFISSPSAGLTTAFAMFLHEIPHKFGDYTIMRQLGFSSRKASTMQFVSALGTMFGCVVGCIIFWMSSNTSSISINELCDNYIMPITTGSLIYLALVGMLPELIQYKPKGVIKNLVQITLEVIFFGMGTYIMRWIALNE